MTYYMDDTAPERSEKAWLAVIGPQEWLCAIGTVNER